MRRTEERAAEDVSLQHSAPDCEAFPAKRLRSSDEFVTSHGSSSTSSAILPANCIFCKRESKFIRNNITGVKFKEKLSKCEHIYLDRLVTAATKKKDEALLLHIKDTDLVAAELQDHGSCYKSYPNILTYQTVQSTEKKKSFPAAFKQLCELVTRRVMKGCEVLRMSKLCSVFEQKVKDLHGFEIIGRSQALKLRLKKNFPQLTFLKPRKKNACEVVMCERSLITFWTVMVTPLEPTKKLKVMKMQILTEIHQQVRGCNYC